MLSTRNQIIIPHLSPNIGKPCDSTGLLGHFKKLCSVEDRSCLTEYNPYAWQMNPVCICDFSLLQATGISDINYTLFLKAKKKKPSFLSEINLA